MLSENRLFNNLKTNKWINRNSTIFYLIIIIIITLVTYSNSIKSGFVLLDDNAKVYENPLIMSLSFSNIIKYFIKFVFHTYMPLTILSYAVDYSLWGLNPWGYHAINLLIHLFNAVLVFIFVRRLTEKPAAALIASLLFAINPINVESVAWISERSNVLFTAFFLVSLLFYLNQISGISGKRNIYFSFLFFILSVLAKPAGVMLPFVILLIDYFKGLKIDRKNILQKAPFFLTSLLFGALTIYSTISTGNVRDISSTFNFTDRIFLSIYPIAFYIIKFIFPFHLSVLHPYPIKSGGWLPWEYYGSLLFVLLIIFLIWKNKSFRKEIIFGFLFFIANISIYLMVVPTGGNFLVVEHFAYVPCIGLALITGLFYSRITGNYKAKWIRTMLPILFTAIILLFSIHTYKRNVVWENSDLLFTDMLNKSPENAFANYAAATFKFECKDYESAIDGFTKTIKIDSTYSDAYYNRALAERIINKYEDAYADFNKAILFKPKRFDAYADRGNMKLLINDTIGAMSDYNYSIELNSEYAPAYYNRGNLALKNKNYTEALTDFSKTIKLNSNYKDAYNNRGIVKYYLKDFAGSIQDYNKAIELNPKNAIAFRNRGLSKIALEITDSACKDFKQSFSLGFEPAEVQILKYCK